MTFDTFQINPISANAGVQQTVNVGGNPSSYDFGNIGAAQAGSGFATNTGGAYDAPTNAVASIPATWGYYFFFFTVLYFAWQKLR